MTASISDVAFFGYRANVIDEQNHTRAHKGLRYNNNNNKKKKSFSVIFLLHRIVYTTNVKKVREKSRECHNHKP